MLQGEGCVCCFPDGVRGTLKQPLFPIWNANERFLVLATVAEQIPFHYNQVKIEQGEKFRQDVKSLCKACT